MGTLSAGVELSSFAGRPAFITGGASGIGLAVATRCVAVGMRPVCLCDRNEAALLAAQQKLGAAAVELYAADVTDIERNQEMARQVPPSPNNPGCGCDGRCMHDALRNARLTRGPLFTR